MRMITKSAGLPNSRVIMDHWPPSKDTRCAAAANLVARFLTKVEARVRALMKETGLDYGDAYAKVKHDFGAESREKKSTATLGHDAQLADWRVQMTQEELQSLTHASVRMAWSQGVNPRG
jgi:hypothetical protein